MCDTLVTGGIFFWGKKMKYRVLISQLMSEYIKLNTDIEERVPHCCLYLHENGRWF